MKRQFFKPSSKKWNLYVKIVSIVITMRSGIAIDPGGRAEPGHRRTRAAHPDRVLKVRQDIIVGVLGSGI